MSTALDALRNVAFVGHPSSGKTTLVDAMAHLLGASARKGSVADKTSICDFEPEEQETGSEENLALVEAVVQPDSQILGRSAQSFRLSRRHGAVLLGISRRGQRIAAWWITSAQRNTSTVERSSEKEAPSAKEADVGSCRWK